MRDKTRGKTHEMMVADMSGNHEVISPANTHTDYNITGRQTFEALDDASGDSVSQSG